MSRQRPNDGSKTAIGSFKSHVFRAEPGKHVGGDEKVVHFGG